MGIVELMARAINQTDLFAERTEAAKNALSALEAAGYVVVPREPTHEMWAAGDEASQMRHALDPIPIEGIWSAMLAPMREKKSRLR